MFFKTVALLIVGSLLCCSVAVAQTTDAPPVPLNCSAATGISYNQTDVFGNWYEVSRRPSAQNQACIQISAGLLSDNTTLRLNISYSNSANLLYQNETEYATIELKENNTAGYNISYVVNGQNQAPIFSKLLANYTTSDGIDVKWLVGCGYTNASDPSTVFAYVLSNQSVVSPTQLNSINAQAAQNFSDFSATNFTTIQQSGCFRSSATTAVPMVSGFIAAIYLLLKTIV